MTRDQWIGADDIQVSIPEYVESLQKKLQDFSKEANKKIKKQKKRVKDIMMKVRLKRIYKKETLYYTVIQSGKASLRHYMQDHIKL